MAAAEMNASRQARVALETLSAEDFETASIRSAAPSYISDAPSYHSTGPHSDPTPPYSPRAPGSTLSASATGTTTTGATPSTSNASSTTASSATGANAARPTTERRYGLPPVPTGPVRTELPALGAFRIPSWSTISSNPTARHYHNVAHRRISRAATAATSERVKQAVLDRIEEQEVGGNISINSGNCSSVVASSSNASSSNEAGGPSGAGAQFRPLEDPYLVGEEAASRARRARLARENGDEVLIREDRRWDWFLGELGLAQMKDWDERERSWRQFRREVESGSRGPLGRLGRRIGARY